MSCDTFTCKLCGGTFHKAWSDAAREAEYVACFPQEHAEGEETVVLCDTCYRKVMGYWKQKLAAAARSRPN